MWGVNVLPTTVAANALPAWLAGEWDVDRDIDRGRGAFTGTATFGETPESDGSVRWHESGTMRLDAFTGATTRTLFLHPGEPWEVRFDDGLPFHPLDLSTGRAEVEHLCGPDVYRGEFELVGDDEFLVRWVVTGPGRDDVIVSRYRRRR